MANKFKGITVEMKLYEEFENLRKEGHIVTRTFNLFVRNAVKEKIRNIQDIIKRNEKIKNELF